MSRASQTDDSLLTGAFQILLMLVDDLGYGEVNVCR